MGRVFDALQREDKNNQQHSERDLRAGRNGSSETADELEPLLEPFSDFDLPDRIGAPSGPRSCEGVILPFSTEDPLTSATVESAETEARARIIPPNGATERLSSAEGDARHTSSNQTSDLRPQTSAMHTTKPYTWLVAQLDKEDLHPRLIMATDPHSSGGENYRTLRTQIFHAAERRPTQIIVITSAVEGEGKTSTALNLAFAIAQSKEKRVLVIDGDLRRPEIAHHLGLAPDKGLGQTLNSECDVMRAVIHIANSNLYLLPASSAAANPTELLSSERLSEILTELRRHFDFILIDSPPVAPFADARLLAHHADAVLMVVRAGAAPYSTVERAIEALPPGRFLGVVLNDANEANSTSHYGKRRFFDWLFSKRRKQPKR
jgi:capsular exopolysaccharide synthesis family protein